MAKRKNPNTISFSEWAGLQTGRIARIYATDMRTSVEREGDRFVMKGRTGKHTLLMATTDQDRLNAHWLAFVASNY